MENIPFFRRTCSAARSVVACVLRGLSWCLMYTIILPLGTMALMALFVLWKDNTTPGKLLVQEIDFVRQTAPARQFPVRECLPSLHDLPGAEEKICRYRAADAADYVRETDRSLMQLVTAFWAILALVYVSLALFTRKGSENSEKKYIRVATADERLKDIFAEDASCISEKITKHHVYFPDYRINKHDEDKR
ncbi:TPA: conjugal transfer pilus-stabilizing protein TraP [Escherichia coli]